MAITDDLPGVEVTVIQKGKPLKEYSDDMLTEDDRTATRYIEAVSGTRFGIHLKVAKGAAFKGDCMTFSVEVDGQRILWPVIEQKDCKKGDQVELVHGLKFTALEIASDGRVFKGEVEKMKKLGSIVITVDHKRFVKRSTQKETAPLVQASEIVSEKAIKGRALSHQVEFDSAVNGERAIVLTKRVKDAQSPAASFVFYYRSLESLKSQRIIPRTPTPPPLEARDFTSLSRAELQEMHKRFKAMKESEAAAVKIKREAEDNNPRPRKISRPKAGDTQLEIGDDGSFHEGSASTLTGAGPEVIELD